MVDTVICRLLRLYHRNAMYGSYIDYIFSVFPPELKIIVNPVLKKNNPLAH